MSSDTVSRSFHSTTMITKLAIIHPPTTQARNSDSKPYQEWVDEAKFQVSKALPMAVAGTFRSLTSILEVQALGHVGTKTLAGRSLALLVVNLTGYPLMYGLGGALESLCSQAYTGGRRNKRIGVYVQHSIWMFLVANIFVALLWLHPSIIFRMLAKTDPEVLKYAETFLTFECLYFPCIVIQGCLKRFLLAQGLMRPTVYFEFAGLASMLLSLQIFVWNPATAIGFIGVPISSTIAYATVLLTNAIYIACSHCKSEWGRTTAVGFKQNAWHIITLGVPCGISGVASYGFADLATIAVAMLGAEELAVQAVLNSSKSAFARTGSYLGMVVSNRVGNLLGARDPAKSLLSAKISIVMTTAATGILAVLMLTFQHSFASFVTKDKSLISALVPLIPMLVVVVVFDMASNVLTGVLRGQGRQGIAAIIRVVALYLLAVPLAYALCFTAGLGLRGLWIGLAVGFVTIAAAEAWLVLVTDWHGEVKRSIERVNGTASAESPAPEATPLLHPNRLC
ncbi:ethionine resistance protein [Coemansia sp. RSA 1365]|nr:ethionine resistance protein [Coemansia sp. RSA 1365]